MSRMAYAQWLVPVVLFTLAPASRGAPEKPPPAVLKLAGLQNSVFNIVFSPDGKYLATASKDRRATLWDTATGKEIRTFKDHGGSVYSVCFSPDGKKLATACADHFVRIWDRDAGDKELLHLQGHTGEVYHVVFSPDGNRLASCGADNSVILWDATKGQQLHKLEGHTNRVVTVSFSPDGTRLASASGTAVGSSTTTAAGEVKIWDTATGLEVRTLSPAGTGVLTVAFSPDGKRLAGACQDRKVRLWETATGDEALKLEGHTLDVYHVVFSPDGRRLASSSAKWNKEEPGEIKLWDLAAAKERASFQGNTMTIWSLAFSPDGNRLASAGGKWNKDVPGEVLLWDVSGVVKPEEKVMALDATQLDALWADLAGQDAARAYRAVWALSASPKETVAFLSGRVKAPPRNPLLERLPQLIKDLNDDSYAVREKATADLEKLGQEARAALTAAKDSPAAEVRRRVELLLEKKSEPPALSADERRAWRTVEVLQRIGTAEARTLLQRLAKEAAGTPLGRDAAAAGK